MWEDEDRSLPTCPCLRRLEQSQLCASLQYQRLKVEMQATPRANGACGKGWRPMGDITLFLHILLRGGRGHLVSLAKVTLSSPSVWVRCWSIFCPTRESTATCSWLRSSGNFRDGISLERHWGCDRDTCPCFSHFAFHSAGGWASFSHTPATKIPCPSTQPGQVPLSFGRSLSFSSEITSTARASQVTQDSHVSEIRLLTLWASVVFNYSECSRIPPSPV